MKERLLIILSLIMLCYPTPPLRAQANNEKEAKELFLSIYNKVFGSEGCFLYYDARLSFFFHSTGWAALQQGKYAYDDTKTHGWCNGKTFYYLDRKRKQIQILNGHSETNGSVMDKFTFSPNNYHYQLTRTQEGLVITIKAKKNVKGVKTAKVLLDAHTHTPKRLSVRIAMMWAKLDISHFRVGGLNQELFIFPKDKYKGYEFIDKRK